MLVTYSFLLLSFIKHEFLLNTLQDSSEKKKKHKHKSSGNDTLPKSGKKKKKKSSRHVHDQEYDVELATQAEDYQQL